MYSNPLISSITTYKWYFRFCFKNKGEYNSFVSQYPLIPCSTSTQVVLYLWTFSNDLLNHFAFQNPKLTFVSSLLPLQTEKMKKNRLKLHLNAKSVMESVVDEGSVIATTCSSIINAHAWMRQIAIFWWVLSSVWGYLQGQTLKNTLLRRVHMLSSFILV